MRGRGRATEFELIRTFLAAFPPARVPVGPGDDCAVLEPTRGNLCVTTDSLVEDVHFTRRHFTLEDIGYKALAVNLSDLAAMGAWPRWFVCALCLPRGFGRREVAKLARGMGPLAAAHGIELVGGNITAAAQLSVTLTAAGETAKGRALTRSGGRAGDALYVSGTLGDARLGLALWATGGGGRRWASSRQRRPLPRVHLGLLSANFATAAIDLSDGFAQDLAHLCRASRVGARIEAGLLPAGAELRAHFARCGGDVRRILHLLQGGEDYELLLAVPEKRGSAFEVACRRAGERVTRVGELTRGAAVVIEQAGERLEAPPGFDHFG